MQVTFALIDLVGSCPSLCAASIQHSELLYQENAKQPKHFACSLRFTVEEELGRVFFLQSPKNDRTASRYFLTNLVISVSGR